MSTALEVPSVCCGRCKKPVTTYMGFVWSDDDDFMCPDGEEQHRLPGRR